jgi:hypothetical protein
MHPVMPMVLTFPFQAIVSDYYQVEGRKYLVTGDGLSGWINIRQANPGTEEAGTKGLIKAHRELFSMFGIPEEI